MIISQNITKYIKNNKKSFKSINLNFGPNHPAAHGVLRLSLSLDGEIVKKTDVHIGLLHRGTEKLMESRPFDLSIPYFDRLDYVSMVVQEHAYCLAVEKLSGFPNIDQKINNTRTVFDELTRLLNHLLAISCHALDVGSMSPLFWAFEEREVIMGFYESASGARMHAAFYRPSSQRNYLSFKLLDSIMNFITKCQGTLKDISGILNENRIWKSRLINIGSYSYREVINYGLSGIMCRCTGLKKDIRFNKRMSYGSYFFSGNRSYVSVNGDSLDRYLLRVQEMFESLLIVSKVISSTSYKDKKTLKNLNGWFCLGKKPVDDSSMENLIRHFKKWSTGRVLNLGITTQVVESPKGEFSVSLISDGTDKPYRCKIRSPAYNHIQFLPKLSKNKQMADLITLIGTIDIVFGEIDR